MSDRQSRGGRPATGDRVPPQDTRAEEALVGAMLLSRAAIESAVEAGVTAADFAKPSLGHLFHAITQLHVTDTPVDAVTVASQLEAVKLLDDVGGPAEITGVMARTPATSSAAHYAHLVLEAAGSRHMLALVGEIEHNIYEAQPLNGQVDRLVELADAAARGWRRGRMELEWGEPDVVPQPEPVLIEGMLRAGELCVMASVRAVGKTFATYNLAKLLADGSGNLFGRLPIARPARVLLCQGELDRWASHSRWQMLGGKPKNVAETWEPWRLRVQRHRRATPDGGFTEYTEATLDPGLEEAIVEHGVEVVVIDPWRTYYAGAENSNDDVEAALSQLTALARRTGVAVVIIHHISGKTDPGRVLEPEDLWRGATRLADWASTRVTILPHYTTREADEAGITREVARRHVDIHFLRRNDKPTADFCAVRNHETGWWEYWPDGTPRAGLGPRSKKASAGTPAVGAPADHYQHVAEALRATGGVWTSAAEARTDLGVSRDKAAQLLHNATKYGLIEKFIVGARACYRLPEAAPPTLHLVPPSDDDAPPPPDDNDWDDL